MPGRLESREVSPAYREAHTCWQQAAALAGGMSDSEQARPPARRRRSTTAVVVVLAVTATIGTALGCQVVATPSSAAAPPLGATESDGVVPDGVTVFDDEFPAVADLDPALLDALRRAATAAADDGVEFTVTSGWRSSAYQEQLLREAV